MWVVAKYHMVSLFSLKLSAATGSGAKSLLVPTPYAFKMALLDAACRTLNVRQAEMIWPTIRDARIALNPPAAIMVTNLFTKFWRPWEFKGKADGRAAAVVEARTEGKYPFQSTIAFREYVQHNGPVGVAFDVEQKQAAIFTDLMPQINYLGKRGSFIQLQSLPERAEELPEGYVLVNDEQDRFIAYGVIQMLDDCAPSLTFQRANIYSGERVTVGKERVIHHIVLPYRLARSSKSFSLYERID